MMDLAVEEDMLMGAERGVDPHNCAWRELELLERRLPFSVA